MADKKLNNLIDFKNYTEKEMNKPATKTKRTETGKDIINEDHKEGKDEQLKYIKSKLSDLSEKDVKKVYKLIEDCCEAAEINEDLLTEGEWFNNLLGVNKMYDGVAKKAIKLLKANGVKSEDEIKSKVESIVAAAKKAGNDGDVFNVKGEIKFVPKKDWNALGIKAKGVGSGIEGTSLK
jgi:hypothetical protein